MSVEASIEPRIAASIARVRERIRSAAEASGRTAADVRLVAVSKTFGLDSVLAARNTGQRVFGESRVQEAREKVEATTELDLEWHLIGHLQSNKIKRAAALFSCIHSVDRLDKLRALDAAAGDLGTRIDVLVQVDLAGEATKHGAPRGALTDLVEAAEDCHSLRLVGLMLLPPFSANPEDGRVYFRELRILRDDIAESISSAHLPELSMGMSHDFEVAIQEGATIVRVGSAIFGERHVRAV